MQPGSDPQAFTRQLAEKSADLRRRAEQLQAELARISESVTSADRTVTVTVGAGGIMRALEVEPAGLRATPSQWSTAVMRAYAEGCRRVGLQAAELVERHTPGSPAVAMMRAAVPPEDQEQSR